MAGEIDLQAQVGNLKSLQETRAILKKLSNNAQLTEAGAKRLVTLHHNLTALAFAKKMDPDSQTPWEDPSRATQLDKRFAGLLTRSGKLLKAALDPEVSYKTKDGATQATIKMRDDPHYGQYQQFGTSNFGVKGDVFVNKRTKRVETAYQRTNAIPARPFFAFAKDNFSNATVYKEVDKTLHVIFEAVADSITRRVFKLPAAEIEGYTSVVTFYSTGGATFKSAKSRTALTREGHQPVKGGGEKLARLDMRSHAGLHKLKTLKHSPELTEKFIEALRQHHLAERAKVMAEGMAEREAARQDRELRKRMRGRSRRERREREEAKDRLYAQNQADYAAGRITREKSYSERIRRAGHGHSATYREFQTDLENLAGRRNRLEQQLRGAESRLNQLRMDRSHHRATDAQIEAAEERVRQLREDIGKLEKAIEALRQRSALVEGFIFNQADTEPQRLRRLNELTTAYHRKLEALERRLDKAQHPKKGDPNPETLHNIHQDMDNLLADYQERYRAVQHPGGQEEEPLARESLRNMRHLARQEEARQVDLELRRKAGFKAGGRPTQNASGAAKIKHAALERRRERYQINTEETREKRAEINASVEKALRMQATLKTEEKIRAFYQRIYPKNLPVAEKQARSAAGLAAQGRLTPEIAALHAKHLMVAKHRITQMAARAKERKFTDSERVRRQGQAADKAGKAESGAAAPKKARAKKADTRTPEEKAAARSSARKTKKTEHKLVDRAALEPLTEAQQVHNSDINAELKKLRGQKGVLQKSGMADLVKAIDEQIDAKKAQLYTPKPKPVAVENVAQKATKARAVHRVSRLEKHAAFITQRLVSSRTEARELAQQGKVTGAKVVRQRVARLARYKERILRRRDLEIQNWSRLTEPSQVTTLNLHGAATNPLSHTVSAPPVAPAPVAKHEIKTRKKE
jgi:hypothetical protein